MDEARVLLIDLRQYFRSATIQPMLESFCRVERLPWQDFSAEAVNAFEPCGLFFDFDFPDMQRLALLSTVRRTHSRRPCVMFTEEHSESLAVWALRTRVWDYIVKPADPEHVGGTVRALYRIALGRDEGEQRAPILPHNSIPNEARFRVNPGEPVLLDGALTYIDRHLGGPLAQRDVAAACGVSTYQFSRAFKRTYGVTFQEYVMERRLAAARRLLKNRSAAITDVCWAVGFRDVSYFGRMFKRHYSETPSEFRDRFARSRDGGVPSAASSSDQPGNILLTDV